MTGYELQQRLASTETIRLASRDVTRAPAWWDDTKTPIAFLVAPLAVPLVMVWILSAPLNGLDRGTTLVVSTFAAYLGVFLALPVYLYLQMREAMTFWLAPIVGFTMGVTTTYVVYFLFGYTSLGALLIPSFFEMRTGLAARPGPLLERYFG